VSFSHKMFKSINFIFSKFSYSPVTPQNNCTLTIKIVAMLCYSPLFNTFSIRDQSVGLLCKHGHNNWEMSSELIAELWLHKSQSWKDPLIFHVAYYLHHGQFNQFDVLKGAGDQYPRCCHKVPQFG
jgi:hypothetical protein